MLVVVKEDQLLSLHVHNTPVVALIQKKDNIPTNLRQMKMNITSSRASVRHPI